MINEIDILKDMDHPNIVNIYEYFEDSLYLYIVMELIEGGCLWDRFFEMRKSLFKSFGENEARKCVKALMSCVLYCHEQNVMHRDLKLENMLLEKNHKLDQLKIIDFGTAKYCT
jgi:calcium-dependent protein kinase